METARLIGRTIRDAHRRRMMTRATPRFRRNARTAWTMTETGRPTSLRIPILQAPPASVGGIAVEREWHPGWVLSPNCVFRLARAGQCLVLFRDGSWREDYSAE